MKRFRCLLFLLPLAAGELHAETSGPVVLLQGVVIAEDRKDLRSDGWARPEVPGVDASHAPEIPQGAAARTLGRFLGKPIDQPLLEQLRQALQGYFKSEHRPFVSVVVPPQPIDSGVVQVLVMVSRLGKITVSGDRWFAARQYTGAIDLRPGASIDSLAIDRGVDQINANPYRHASVVAWPGEAVGTTDLQVRTEERFPATFRSSVGNTGTASTGLTQLNAGVDWGNAFGRGDQLSAGVLSSSDRHRLRAYNASYVASLPWGNSLSLAGSYAQSRVFSDSFIGNTGLNRTLAVRDSFPVPSWGSVAQQHVTLGFDYKSTNNDLLFGGVSVFPTSTQIYEFSAGYGAAIDDRLGSTRWTATVTASPGGLSSENEDATFAAQRTGARAHYLYGKVSVARDFHLPRGFSWSTQVSFQAANANLLPSEEMAFGGSASVRGFAEQTAVRDNGVLAQTELSVPPLMPGLPGRLGIPAIADRLIAFAFLDYGLGRDHATPPGISSRIELASAGPGLRYQVGRNLSVCLTYGVPLLTRGPVAYSRTQFFLEVTL